MKVPMLMSQNCSSNAIGSLKAGCIIVLIAFTLFSISVNQALAQPFDPGPDDDLTTSLGTFRIFVNSQFRPLMWDPFLSYRYPGYDEVTYTLTSPLMFDGNTIIGRSDPHPDGGPIDINGAVVGLAGNIIRDSDFSFVPVGFEGPANTMEVHTEVYSLEMVDDQDCGFGYGVVFVRAGIKAPLRPMSPGEVESKSLGGTDFPAESFFNVFVEVDLPGFPPGGSPIFPGGTLYNSTALVITNDNLDKFPPRVVYTHGNTLAVPVLFLDDDPGGYWNKDDEFGWLVLAGHGPEFTCDTTDVNEFQEIVFSQPELSLPFSQVTFDPLALGTVYDACGTTIFTENDVVVSIEDFMDIGGGTTCNFAQVDLPFSGFGVDHIMNTNNINLEFDFLGLGFQAGYVSFEFADLGGEVNISVNGSQLYVVADLTLAPINIAPGVTLSVIATAIPGGIRGKVELRGPVSTLRVGGQEFWIDNILALDDDLTTSVNDRNSQEGSLPKVFALQQNYPNPFNPSTVIKYSVPEYSFVKLSVYNLVGEEVSVLVNETVDAGFYEVTFNATSLPSGIYFYRLQAGNTVQAKKMVLLR